MQVNGTYLIEDSTYEIDTICDLTFSQKVEYVLNSSTGEFYDSIMINNTKYARYHIYYVQCDEIKHYD